MAIITPDPQVRQSTLESVCTLLLRAIGEDPNRPGLQDTPRRWASFWAEFLNYDPGNVDTTFEAIEIDQMVIASGIRVWSLCEHHLLPFWCDISVGYLTADRVLGLSKFARLAHQFAHKLQLQERLVQQIADEVGRLAATSDVAVLARGYHTCTLMRGVRTPTLMTSSVMRGAFRDGSELRAEFLGLVERHVPAYNI